MTVVDRAGDPHASGAASATGSTTGLTGGETRRGPRRRRARLWHAWLDGWHGAGLGQAGEQGPHLVVLSGLSWLAAHLPFLLSAPASPVGAVVTAARHLRAPAGHAHGIPRRPGGHPLARWPRALAALAWSTTAVLATAVGSGRLGAIVAAVLLPLVAAGVALAGAPGRQRHRHGRDRAGHRRARAPSCRPCSCSSSSWPPVVVAARRPGWARVRGRRPRCRPGPAARPVGRHAGRATRACCSPAPACRSGAPPRPRPGSSPCCTPAAPAPTPSCSRPRSSSPGCSACCGAVGAGWPPSGFGRRRPRRPRVCRRWHRASSSAPSRSARPDAGRPDHRVGGHRPARARPRPRGVGPAGGRRAAGAPASGGVAGPAPLARRRRPSWPPCSSAVAGPCRAASATSWRPGRTRGRRSRSTRPRAASATACSSSSPTVTTPWPTSCSAARSPTSPRSLPATADGRPDATRLARAVGALFEQGAAPGALTPAADLSDHAVGFVGLRTEASDPRIRALDATAGPQPAGRARRRAVLAGAARRWRRRRRTPSRRHAPGIVTGRTEQRRAGRRATTAACRLKSVVPQGATLVLAEPAEWVRHARVDRRRDRCSPRGATPRHTPSRRAPARSRSRCSRPTGTWRWAQGTTLLLVAVPRRAVRQPVLEEAAVNVSVSGIVRTALAALAGAGVVVAASTAPRRPRPRPRRRRRLDHPAGDDRRARIGAGLPRARAQGRRAAIADLSVGVRVAAASAPSADPHGHPAGRRRGPRRGRRHAERLRRQGRRGAVAHHGRRRRQRLRRARHRAPSRWPPGSPRRRAGSSRRATSGRSVARRAASRPRSTGSSRAVPTRAARSGSCSPTRAATPVTVDVTLHGPQGRVASPQGKGIVVPAHGRTGFLLDSISGDLDAPAVHVVAEGGVVGAVVNDTLARRHPRGGARTTPSRPPRPPATRSCPRWRSAAAAVAAGRGARHHGGGRPGRVLTPQGPRALPTGGVLRLEPGTTRDVDLSKLPADTVGHPGARGRPGRRGRPHDADEGRGRARRPGLERLHAPGRGRRRPAARRPRSGCPGRSAASSSSPRSGDTAGVEVVTVDAKGVEKSQRPDRPRRLDHRPVGHRRRLGVAAPGLRLGTGARRAWSPRSTTRSGCSSPWRRSRPRPSPPPRSGCARSSRDPAGPRSSERSDSGRPALARAATGC